MAGLRKAIELFKVAVLLKEGKGGGVEGVWWRGSFFRILKFGGDSFCMYEVTSGWV